MSATIYTHVIILALSTFLSGLTLRHLNTGDAQEFVQSSFAALYEVDSGLRDEGTLIDIDLLVPLLREDCGEARYPRQTGYSFPVEWSSHDEPDGEQNYGANVKARQRYDQRPVNGYYHQNKGPAYQNAGRPRTAYNPMLYHAPSHGQYMPVPKLYPNGERPVLHRYNYPNARKVANSPYVPTARRPGWNLAPASRPESLQANRPINRPDSRPVNRPDSLPASRPDNLPAIRPDNLQANRPDSLPASRPDSLPANRPDSLPANRPGNRPDSRPTSRPTSRPVSHPPSLPVSNPVGYNIPDSRRLPNTGYLQMAGRPGADLRSNRPPMHYSPAAGRTSNNRYLQMAKQPAVNMAPGRHLDNHRPVYPMKMAKLSKYNGLDRSHIMKPVRCHFQEMLDPFKSFPCRRSVVRGEWNVGYGRGRHFANFGKLSKVKQQSLASDQISEEEREETMLQDLLKENGYEGELVGGKQGDQLIPDAISKLEDSKEEDQREGDQKEEDQKETDQKEDDQKVEDNEHVEALETHQSNEENSDDKKENEGEKQAEDVDHKDEDPQPKITKEEGQKEDEDEPTEKANEVNEGLKVANKQMMAAEREHPEKITPLRDGKEGGPLGLSKALAHPVVSEVKKYEETKKCEETTTTSKSENNDNEEPEEEKPRHETFPITEKKKEDKLDLPLKQDNTDRDFQEEKQRSKTHAMCLAAIVVGVLVVLYFVVGWFYWSLVWKKAYLTQEPPPYYDRLR